MARTDNPRGRGYRHLQHPDGAFFEGPGQEPGKVVGVGDPFGPGAEGAGVGGVVEAVGHPFGVLEVGAGVAPVVLRLVEGDRGVARVVGDQPDGVDAGRYGGGQRRQAGHDRPVADQRHHRGVRAGEPHPDRGGHLLAHRSEPAGHDLGPRLQESEVLPDGVADSHPRDQDRLRRQQLPQEGCQVGRLVGEAGFGAHLAEVVGPGPLLGGQLLPPPPPGPAPVDAFLQRRRQLLEAAAGVPHQSGVGGVDLADLVGVDVHVDQPGGRDGREMVGPPAVAVHLGQAGARRRQQVGPAGGAVGGPGPDHSCKADGEGVLLGDCTLAAHGGGDGKPEPVGEMRQGFRGAGDHRPAAGEQQGALRPGDQAGGLFHLGAVGADLPRTDRPAGRRRRHPRREVVERNLQHDGAGASAQGVADRPVEQAGQLGGGGGGDDPLGEGTGDVELGVVDRVGELLQGLLPRVGAGHAACDHDHGRGIEQGVSQPGHDVREARPHRGRHHRDPPARPEVGVGGVGPDLLVEHRHVGDRPAVLEGVDEGQVAVADQPEHGVDPLLLHGADQGGRPGDAVGSARRSPLL